MVCDMPVRAKHCRLAGLGVSAGNSGGSACYLYDDDCLTTWRREEWCGEGASSGECQSLEEECGAGVKSKKWRGGGFLSGRGFLEGQRKDGRRAVFKLLISGLLSRTWHHRSDCWCRQLLAPRRAWDSRGLGTLLSSVVASPKAALELLSLRTLEPNCSHKFGVVQMAERPDSVVSSRLRSSA